ncbi:MAG: hypothetical protein KDK44_06700, partial [Chlamydiia bacterium]|nr:hypothetical protein [Chlamydiia bacterium]
MIPADMPFLGLIEQALTNLFENRPIAANHPHVAGKLKTFPFNFPKAIQANLNVFVPLLTKFFKLLEDCKTKELTATAEHRIYAYLGTINELWLTSIMQDIESIPQKQGPWIDYAQKNGLPGKINPKDLKHLTQVQNNTLTILHQRLSELKEHCKTHVFSEQFLPTYNAQKWQGLEAWAQKARKEGIQKYLKTLCPLVGRFCVDKEGEQRLVSFFPSIQEKLNHCQNFDPRFLEAAFEKRFLPNEHEARFLCEAFLNLIAFIADGNSDLGTAPAIFLNAWRRFVLLQNRLELPQILKTNLPIQTKPNFSFFEHWVSLCPKNEHLAASFTPQNLFDAYTNRDPASNGLIIAADVLFVAGPSNKKALCALQNAWIKLQLKVWISLCPQSDHFAAVTFTEENLFKAYSTSLSPTLTRAINALFEAEPSDKALLTLQTEWFKIAPAWIKDQLERWVVRCPQSSHYAATSFTAGNLFNAYSTSSNPALTEAINSLVRAGSSDDKLLSLQAEWLKMAPAWIKQQLENWVPRCSEATLTSEKLLEAYYDPSTSPALIQAVNALLEAGPNDPALHTLQTEWLKQQLKCWITSCPKTSHYAASTFSADNLFKVYSSSSFPALNAAINSLLKANPNDKTALLTLQTEWFKIAPIWIKEQLRLPNCPKTTHYAAATFTADNLFQAYSSSSFPSLTKAINSLLKANPNDKTVLPTLQTVWLRIAPAWIKEQLEYRLLNCPKSDHYAAGTLNAENLFSTYSTSSSPALTEAVNSLLKANPNDTAALLNLQTVWIEMTPARIKEQLENSISNRPKTNHY